MDDILRLSRLSAGDVGIVKSLKSKPEIRRRLQDMGLTPGTRVTCVFKSPYGDPIAYLIRGALVALRLEDAESIFISIKNGGV